MAGGPRRPGFYLGVLTTGFLAGGFLTALLRRFLPESAARDFFTTAVTANLTEVLDKGASRTDMSDGWHGG